MISALVEGNSIRAVARMTGISRNIITALLVDPGAACAEFQDKARRNLRATTVTKEVLMKVYSIDRETWIPKPVPEVFDFFSRAGNLERLTPPWMRFRILTPQPIRMRAGTLIDYKLRVHGFPVRWRTRIESWNPPLEFIDLQLKGPYKLWHHTHRFIASGGGTLITDSVRYGLSFGLAGQLVNGLLVSRDVAEIFDYRAEKIREFFPL